LSSSCSTASALLKSISLCTKFARRSDPCVKVAGSRCNLIQEAIGPTWRGVQINVWRVDNDPNSSPRADRRTSVASRQRRPFKSQKNRRRSGDDRLADPSRQGLCRRARNSHRMAIWRKRNGGRLSTLVHDCDVASNAPERRDGGRLGAADGGTQPSARGPVAISIRVQRNHTVSRRRNRPPHFLS